MKVLGVQAVQSTPESLLLLDSPLVGASGTEEGRGVGALFLHIGQQLSLERLLACTTEPYAAWHAAHGTTLYLHLVTL